MEIFNTIISLLALTFSAYTYWWHDKKIKLQEQKLNQYELNKIELEQVESKKAIVEASVIKGLKGKRIIKVYNKGKSKAKNVIVTFPENVDFYITENPCPIDLKPQQEVDISVLVHRGSPEKTIINFEWADENQEKNSESQMLQL